MAIVPIIPGLVQDNSLVIYNWMDGDTRYVMSMVSKEWYLYCTDKKPVGNGIYVIKKVVKSNDILRIIRNLDGPCKRLQIFFNACRYECITLINILIKKGVCDWDGGLGGACRGGRMRIAQLMIEKGAIDFDSGLYNACRSGNMAIVQMMIINKASYARRWGLHTACQSGNIEIVKLTLEKLIETRGTIFYYSDELNPGLAYACTKWNTKKDSDKYATIIQLLIETGASYCTYCNKTMQEHLDLINS